MLRGCAIAGGALLLIGGIVVIALARAAWPAGVECLIFGALTLASLAFERRYRSRQVAGNAAQWEPTGERFIDPGSGRLVEVRYNPRTGERAYREIDERSSQM